MEQDFCTLYESLKPALAQLETRRLELKAQGTKNGSIAAGICCLLGIAVTLCTGMNWAWLLVSAIIGGIIFFYCIQIKSGELTSLYKQNIIFCIYLLHIQLNHPAMLRGDFRTGQRHK